MPSTIRTLWQDVRQPKQPRSSANDWPQRKAKGITQRELADRLGTTREMVDYYERRAVNPALEVVRGCAKALSVPVIELLGSEHNANVRKKRGSGPTGKMRRLFEAASPRSQQEKLTAVLEAFVNQHAIR